MLETGGGGFCMEKHPSVEVTLFGIQLSFCEILVDWLLCVQRNHRNTGQIQIYVNECSKVCVIVNLSHY